MEPGTSMQAAVDEGTVKQQDQGPGPSASNSFMDKPVCADRGAGSSLSYILCFVVNIKQWCFCECLS